MGTIRNEMTIVHHWDKEELEKVREDAIKFFGEKVREDAIKFFSESASKKFITDAVNSVITPIMSSYANQEYTFIINGDCSKIGWETSKRFHEARMEWCEKHKHDAQNIIVINFGEDGPCEIVFDNQAESEEKK